jgi:protein-disulfide isomerase
MKALFAAILFAAAPLAPLAAQPDAAEPPVPASAEAPAEPKIDSPFGSAWLGAADGDATLIVFADYACPACREAQPVIDQLIAADPRLKVVYRILVNESEGLQAARTSIAVAGLKDGDWARFHRALDAAGAPTEEAIAKALAAAGIDAKALPRLDDDSLAGSSISNELINNEEMMVDRKGKAIPAYVLGDSPARNGFELAKLQAAIAKARSARPR